MEKQKIKDKKLPVGFTFSFPCAQSKLDEVNTLQTLSLQNDSGDEQSVTAAGFTGGPTDMDKEV